MHMRMTSQREIILKELQESHQHLTADELASNKAQLKSQLMFALEGVHNQMYRAARNEIHYGRFVPVTELVDGFYADVQAMGGARWDTSSLIQRLRKS